jgi:hypothetical protein
VFKVLDSRLFFRLYSGSSGEPVQYPLIDTKVPVRLLPRRTAQERLKTSREAVCGHD